MKNKIICCLTAFLIAIASANLPVNAAQPAVQEDFYQQLAGLIDKQDYSKFFNEMELRVGSDILTVDGKTQVLTAAPEITDNRTMLPIRAVAEAAGAEVDWESATSTILIESANGDMINCSVGSDIITVNDQISRMDVTPYIKRDKTYMPMRAVAEALELDVDWEAATQTIRLTAPYQTARLIVLADQLDIRGLDLEMAISDGAGMWVLQFTSPAQAREAAETMGTQGIVVEPDRYIPPIKDDAITELAATGIHYSWGVEDCGFDSFVGKYAGLFTEKGIVAVVDSGVDFGHPFLRGRVLSSGYDFIDGDATPNDGLGHGTHVTGIIIDCVDSTPVDILPIRIFDDHGGGAYDSTVAAGVKYAANHGADVINLSLGGGCSKIQDSAISYAIGKGCLVVASAGNDNTNTADYCPAHITEGGMIVVSAGDSIHNRANFTNYGNSVDMMCPGVAIKAAIPGGSFGNKDGTSMAAPHAAAAAILLDLAWGKTLTPAVLEGKVHSATTYGYWNNQYEGFGFLNMRNADLPLTSYQIYFDSNGGSSPISNKKVVQGQAYGELPEPTRTGYYFDGWYTSKSDGEQIMATTIVNLSEDQTLYAHWRDHSTAITFHSLTVPNDLVEGNQAHVDGEIRSSGSPITAVKAEVFDTASRSVVLSAASSGFSVSTYGPIKNSKIDTELNFSLLTAGTYYVKYIASAEDGTTNTAETSTFQVVTPPKENISYADCDVEVACFKGQVVNLYDNPGDSNRITYFSKGQRPRSIYYTTLSDGSIWYRVYASHQGDVNRIFWLKYEPDKMALITYSDCNVEVACLNGQIVNLYDNPGDTTRVSYFSKGQIARSIYCATLSDGSTWYKVNAFEGETYRTFWLKYEPDKMTVT